MLHVTFRMKTKVWLVLLVALHTVLNLSFGESGVENTPSSVCGIQTYDYSNLTRPASWMFIDKSFCLDKMDTSPKCAYIFSFCKKLAFPKSACNNAAACQLDLAQGSTQARKYKLGSYDATVNPFTERNENPGFTVVYDHGEEFVDPNTNLSEPLSVAIQFNCNKKVPWIADAGAQQVPVPGEKTVKWQPEIFTFWIEVNFAGACMNVNPATNTEYLSAGTILIIILVCCVTLYCAVGCSVKAFMGRRGAEMIPNYDMWSKLPTYTQEGCAIFWACICCQERNLAVAEKPLSASAKGYDSI